MLEKPCCLLLHKLRDHVAKYSAHSIESFISGTYIVEAVIIKKDLLHNEYGNCLA